MATASPAPLGVATVWLLRWLGTSTIARPRSSFSTGTHATAVNAKAAAFGMKLTVLSWTVTWGRQPRAGRVSYRVLRRNKTLSAWPNDRIQQDIGDFHHYE